MFSTAQPSFQNNTQQMKVRTLNTRTTDIDWCSVPTGTDQRSMGI